MGTRNPKRMTKTIGAIAAFLLAGGMTYLVLSPVKLESTAGNKSPVNEPRALAEEISVKKAAKAKTKVLGTSGLQNLEGSDASDSADDMSSRDQTIIDRIQAALDAENLEGIRRMIAEARASSSPEVRQEIVDALGWFDAKALADLTPFLRDSDPDVAQSAFDYWDSAVDAVDDEDFKIAVTREAMKSLTDPDMLENVSSKLTSAEDEAKAADAIADILRNVKAGSAAEKVAREAFEFISGEDYTSPDAVTLWALAKRQEQSQESE